MQFARADGTDFKYYLPDNSKMTKQLVDVLAPLQDSDVVQFILVEGLPGIGKSLLLQEIAYEWGTGKLLQKYKAVVLVELRNPAVQQISNITDLFQLVCKGDAKAPEIATACSDYFFNNKGKDIVFLFDGLDEFPEYLQKDSLIASILKRQILSCCGLVVSSRPHVSVVFREQATVKIEILGFAQEERKLFIEQLLKAHPHDISVITKYLESNKNIDSLCFIPFNLVVLIYLHKQGTPLPSNSVELYNHFICFNICRHLAKSGHSLDNTIINLTDLPEPCSSIVKQLSKLSLEALKSNKLIFTWEEVKRACPNIDSVPGAINGFGLLHAVQHFGLTGQTKTFNFIHFSIQEYLAAYCITQLPQHEELQVLKARFWNNLELHSNVFVMYTWLTRGQNSALKQFLSCGDSTIMISEIFLKDKLTCLRLFHAFSETGDKAMCKAIQKAKIFTDKVIDLTGTRLSVPYDVECLALFLTSSPHNEWVKLDLFDCKIRDHGLRVLHHGLISSDVTIKAMLLICNGLTHLSSAAICDLALHCRVEELWIGRNHTIGEGHILYNVLSSSSSRLVGLYMESTGLSSSAAFYLFTAIVKGSKLQQLWIRHNEITDDACEAIVNTLKENTSLAWLWLFDNKISAEAAISLVQALHFNNTLEKLWLPRYPEDIKKRIKYMQEEIIKNRESRGCQTNLDIDC